MSEDDGNDHVSDELRVEAVTLVRVTGGGAPNEVVFESEDIGCTQGTTLKARDEHGELQVVARYRPGTKHRERALETAEGFVLKAAARMRRDGVVWWTAARWEEYLGPVITADPHATPWDERHQFDDLDAGDSWPEWSRDDD